MLLLQQLLFSILLGTTISGPIFQFHLLTSVHALRAVHNENYDVSHDITNSNTDVTNINTKSIDGPGPSNTINCSVASSEGSITTVTTATGGRGGTSTQDTLGIGT